MPLLGKPRHNPRFAMPLRCHLRQDIFLKIMQLLDRNKTAVNITYHILLLYFGVDVISIVLVILAVNSYYQHKPLAKSSR